jgi:hypothetical protein
MTSLRISLCRGDQGQDSGMKLAPGVRHISEIMSLVLAARGLSGDDEPDAKRPEIASKVATFDMVITAMESISAS